ncbi:YbgA family protein [Salinispirillum marinum]|uniref:YbgA family protein n=2 Tax=Saccharospirillaceae TaxID=255527 RepID=A0ABV8BG29_9GAMM
MDNPLKSDDKPRIGISACVMGDEVRYNGGHKKHAWIANELAPHLTVQKFCPEFEIGLGVPRETIRLVDHEDGIHAVSHSGERDVTQPMRQLAEHYTQIAQQWDGIIFMHNSPSCGLNRVKLYLPNGYPLGNTQGLFAADLQAAHPLLPMEDAGRLNDAHIREHFLTRVYMQYRWRTLNPGQSAKDLLAFHSRSKYLVMAYSYPVYKSLGQLLSNVKSRPWEETAAEYYRQLNAALANPPKRGQITNVLQHIQGYLKDNLSSERKQSLRAAIDKYRAGLVPMIVPMTLLQHHLDSVWDDDSYIRQQFFLAPYPETLGLRNTI